MLAVSNLDFEEELANPDRYRPSRAMVSLMERWRYLLRLLPGARLAECLDSRIRDSKADEPDGLTAAPCQRLLFWGVTPSTLALARKLGQEASFPSLESVREVNDKRFSHRLETELGLALPYSREITSLSELQSAISDCPHDWVLKHPLGFSGRERALGKRGRLSESALGWAKRRLDAGWTLIFEPWVEEKTEVSLHFELTSSGQVETLGHTLLRSDSGGVYRGNAVLPERELPGEIRDASRRIVEKVAQRGYWGPVGIDAMTGHLGDTEVRRPLTEINARFSFGRMALALGDLLPPGWAYRWWHPRAADQNLALRVPELPSNPRAGIHALPEWVDPARASRTLLLLAPSAVELEQLEPKVTEL